MTGMTKPATPTAMRVMPVIRRVLGLTFRTCD